MNIDIDETLNDLKQTTLDHQIDVVDRVMAAVEARPTLKVVRRRSAVLRWSMTAAAAAVLMILFNVTLLYTRDYNEAQIGDMIAGVYSYGDELETDYDPMFEFVESFCNE